MEKAFQAGHSKSNTEEAGLPGVGWVLAGGAEVCVGPRTNQI